MLGGTACDDPLEIQRVLSRFTRTELPQALSAISVDVDVQAYRTKTQAVQQACTYILQTYGGLSHGHLATLDLLALEIKQLARKWTAFRAVDPLPGTSDMLSAQAIEDNTSAQLDSYFSHHVTAKQIEASHFVVRIYLGQQQVGPSSTTIMAAYVPEQPFLVFTNIPKSATAIFTACMAHAFGFKKLQPIELTGTKPAALLNLLVHKHSQGHLSMYRAGLYDHSPLNRRPQKKPKVDTRDLDGGGIVHADRDALEDIRAKEFEDFGLLDPPTLQRAELQLETTFKGGVALPAPFRCTVKLQGKSVLAGIKQLARNKLTTSAKLPQHLRELASAGANKIIITDS
ncbi:hypothetical protein PTSG_12209 [Salpingoeca rosetta]|uniref:Uncharacterized protein n=1 Tax=Salpingoeca rosetta (strain ATCC 50818 / BSB-021) TaxID=946362 RepID=F2U9L6_SALR5|nr:uncharacterized protein PTSG_12209 [Salpingoeca rosetta]EGD73043.1 hypothetical protein PTSG_12209 [Salpingoeca rosetta]|eukprot:XP_004994074.1 hypothetical protein PTSG_12209 [Salpingoeca rosetta]